MGDREEEEVVARPADRALASEAPSGLQPPAFDPSRITDMLRGIDEKCLEPIIRSAADNFYVQVTDAARDYLLENLDYNLQQEVRHLQDENQRMRTELYETRRMVGNPHGPHEETLQAIALLDRDSARYQTLIYAVGKKFEGEERHETALRYIMQTERLCDSDRSGEAVETTGSTVGESAGRQASPTPDIQALSSKGGSEL